VPSLLRGLVVPRIIQITREIPNVTEGTVVVVEVLKHVNRRADIESLSFVERDSLENGDIVLAVLGKRRGFNSCSCDVPETLAVGDVLYWSSASGIVGVSQGYDPAWGKPAAARVIGSPVVSGKQLANLKEAYSHIVPRLKNMELPSSAPIVCVAGTSTNTGKTRTANTIIRHFRGKGQKVACAKLTGVGLCKELQRLSEGNGELVLGFMDAGLPSTCSDANEVLEVALRILHQLNQMEPDVIVVELGASFLGPYNAETILRCPEIKRHIAALVLAATDPVSAWGAKQIMERWMIEITAFTGPLVNSTSFVSFVEDTLGVPAEDNRGQSMPKIAALVESKVEECKSSRGARA
jgi:hypothetical protein